MHEIRRKRAIEINQTFEGRQVLERIAPLTVHPDRMVAQAGGFDGTAEAAGRRGDVNLISRRGNTLGQRQAVPVEVPVARHKKKDAARMHGQGAHKPAARRRRDGVSGSIATDCTAADRF